MECWREGEHSSLLGTWFLERRAGQWFFSSQSCVQKEARGWCFLDVRLLYLCEDRQFTGMCMEPESWNHGVVWVGETFKSQLIQPLP